MELAVEAAAQWSRPTSWFSRTAAAAVRAAAARTLERGAVVAIDRPQGSEIRCLGGRLWMAHDDERRNHLLASGDSFVAERSSRLLVLALDDAQWAVVRRSRRGSAA